jgi:hypothetical protein
MTLRLYGMLTVSLILTGSCMPTGAQTVGDKGGRMSKVTPELAALYAEYSAYLASHPAEVFRPTNPLVRIIGDRVVVDAVASDDVDVLKSDLVSLGMQQAVAFGRIVSGQLPISAIPAMAALSSLNSARAASASVRGGQDSLSPGKADR